MAKRFDIHEWQAKQKLAEQEEFTPDLEDDELKRGAIQQMMAKEKEPMGGDEKLRNAIETTADMYSYGEILDALESFYIKNDEQVYAKMARKHAKEFRDFLDSEDELDEANVTGTGTSISTGDSPAYATPFAFGKKKDKDIEVLGYKKVNEKTDKSKIPHRKSGYMGYSEPVGENEEEEKEYSRDVEALEKLIDDKINTRDEWVDMFQLLMAHSEEIQGLSDSQIKSLLQQSLKDI